jgi:flagellar biogenesis protein FliO
MNSFLNSLENRFGRFAIPGLVAILAIIQVAVWVLLKISPQF